MANGFEWRVKSGREGFHPPRHEFGYADGSEALPASDMPGGWIVLGWYSKRPDAPADGYCAWWAGQRHSVLQDSEEAARRLVEVAVRIWVSMMVVHWSAWLESKGSG